MSGVHPCYEQSEPYDALIDASGETRATRAAAAQALSMCRTCPVQPACFARNHREIWVVLIQEEAQRQAARAAGEAARRGAA